jgi:hypothetical protein
MTELDPKTEPQPLVDGEALAVAVRIRETMDAWVGRMAAAGGAGRGATSIARMATARALAELRAISAVDGDGAAEALVAGYLRRSRALVAQAAQDIERNRYSLQQMDAQLHRLDDTVHQIFPEDEEAEGSDSGQAPGGADDRRADGEVTPS